jgi:DDE superfamily endonuclease
VAHAAARRRYGLLGRIVDELAPFTEADPVGILGHAIAGLGNLIGAGSHTCVAADVHPCRCNVMLVGETSTGRKGSAWGPVRSVLERGVPLGWPAQPVLLSHPRWHVHRSRARALRARAQAAFSRAPHSADLDGLGGHKTRYMTTYVRRQRAWLTVERLPAYAPELNPIEQVWGSVKTRELANVCAPDLASLRQPLRCGFARIRQQPTLARAFLHHAGLSF